MRAHCGTCRRYSSVEIEGPKKFQSQHEAMHGVQILRHVMHAGCTGLQAITVHPGPTFRSSQLVPQGKEIASGTTYVWSKFVHNNGPNPKIRQKEVISLIYTKPRVASRY